MKDIKAMLPDELAAALKEMGEPAYRAKQIFQWLTRGVASFDEMTNLSKPLREKLQSSFSITSLKMLRKQVSAQDGTIKYLWELPLSSRKHCLHLVAGRMPTGLRFLCQHDRRPDPRSGEL